MWQTGNGMTMENDNHADKYIGEGMLLQTGKHEYYDCSRSCHGRW